MLGVGGESYVGDLAVGAAGKFDEALALEAVEKIIRESGPRFCFVAGTLGRAAIRRD
jgi:hypothetical protein